MQQPTLPLHLILHQTLQPMLLLLLGYMHFSLDPHINHNLTVLETNPLVMMNLLVMRNLLVMMNLHPQEDIISITLPDQNNQEISQLHKTLLTLLLILMEQVIVIVIVTLILSFQQS